MKDSVFSQEPHKQFEFDERIASVFDDMLERSVPHYKETISLISDFCVYNMALLESSLDSSDTKPIIYDLGSSTGTMLLSLSQVLPHTRLIGIDSAKAMIDKSTLKAKAYSVDIDFIHTDVLTHDFLHSHIIIANYILQFIRPMQRPSLLAKIYNALIDNGVFIMSEKMISHDKVLDKQMIEHYLRYKMAQGYSKNEISKKREALENVLVPFSMDENIAMLKNVGFKSVEILYKWVNFATIIARK